MRRVGLKLLSCLLGSSCNRAQQLGRSFSPTAKRGMWHGMLQHRQVLLQQEHQEHRPSRKHQQHVAQTQAFPYVAQTQAFPQPHTLGFTRSHVGVRRKVSEHLLGSRACLTVEAVHLRPAAVVERNMQKPCCTWPLGCACVQQHRVFLSESKMGNCISARPPILSVNRFESHFRKRN